VRAGLPTESADSLEPVDRPALARPHGPRAAQVSRERAGPGRSSVAADITLDHEQDARSASGFALSQGTMDPGASPDSSRFPSSDDPTGWNVLGRPDTMNNNAVPPGWR